MAAKRPNQSRLTRTVLIGRDLRPQSVINQSENVYLNYFSRSAENPNSVVIPAKAYLTVISPKISYQKCRCFSRHQKNIFYDLFLLTIGVYKQRRCCNLQCIWVDTCIQCGPHSSCGPHLLV